MKLPYVDGNRVGVYGKVKKRSALVRIPYRLVFGADINLTDAFLCAFRRMEGSCPRCCSCPTARSFNVPSPWLRLQTGDSVVSKGISS